MQILKKVKIDYLQKQRSCVFIPPLLLSGMGLVSLACLSGMIARIVTDLSLKNNGMEVLKAGVKLQKVLREKKVQT